MQINPDVTSKYAEKSAQELADAPLSALTGVSKKAAHMLEREFHVTTIAGFSRLGFVQAVNAIMAPLEAAILAQEAAGQELLDEALAMSFPSSDPVSVTSAIKHLNLEPAVVASEADPPTQAK